MWWWFESYSLKVDLQAVGHPFHETSLMVYLLLQPTHPLSQLLICSRAAGRLLLGLSGVFYVLLASLLLRLCLSWLRLLSSLPYGLIRLLLSLLRPLLNSTQQYKLGPLPLDQAQPHHNVNV